MFISGGVGYMRPPICSGKGRKLVRKKLLSYDTTTNK